MNSEYPFDSYISPFDSGEIKKKEYLVSKETEKFAVNAATVESDRHSTNQDALLIDADTGLFGVLDGVGGLPKGELASAAARDYIINYIFSAPAETETRDLLGNAAIAAGEYLKDLAKKENAKDMSTTLSIIKLEKDQAVLAHVGDSRIYLFRDGQLSQITIDDSTVYENIQEESEQRELQKELSNAKSAEDLSPKYKKYFKQYFEERHIATQLIGQPNKIYPQVYTVPTKNGDVFVICSDGVSDNLIDNEIEKILAESDQEKIAQNLINDAVAESHRGNERSKPDDTTALVIKVKK